MADGKRSLEVFKKRALQLESTHTRFWKPEDDAKTNKMTVEKIFSAGVVAQPVVAEVQSEAVPMEEVQVNATAATMNGGRCFKCNKQGHMARHCMKTKTCSKCNRIGHKASDCRLPFKCFECGKLVI